MNKIFLSFLLSLALSLGIAQEQFWSNVEYSTIDKKGTQYIFPKKFKTIHLDYQAFKEYMWSAPMHDLNASIENSAIFISLPLPDQTTASFYIVESPVYENGFSATFPNIKTFLAYNPDHPEWYTRIDITPLGFHAMIMGTEHGSIFIDPVTHGGKDVEHYLVYYKKDFSRTAEAIECYVESIAQDNSLEKQQNIIKSFGTCQLRTYRLALSATGEYTTFHGGSVANAAAAQVTTINRVNGVYERDMAIHLNIIANNAQIIYVDANNDPFTNGTPSAMITENQTNTDNIIGSANYDIGHVFGTNSGGLAGLGVVCSNWGKARGVTGSAAPIGDPFDIDYVAHEMGHQFNGNHTQNNSCNRNNTTAMEPGSASTIMGYAGICAPNVQNNSDDYFHGITLEEIDVLITGIGHTCPTTTALSNSAPIISNASVNNITLPASTPFALTATATDANANNVLTYCWEQMDNEVATMPPVATATEGPSFRSFDPSTNPTRYFPNLNDLIAGNTTTWEVLPSVSRSMSFRVVVRDNAFGGGCNDHQDITINFDASAGPFLVQNPNNTNITWTGNATETITWDVANTNTNPVNCGNVDILISTDGGGTFTVLAANVTNDGSQNITVPNTATTQAIIMVQCANGTFFDVSDNVFEIITSSCTPSTSTDIQSACNSYAWIDGNTYTTNNNTATHTIVGGAANGCDSIVTLNLTITGSVNGTDIQSACNSYAWIDGMTYTANNNTATHTIVGGAANGCDSIVTLNLTITGNANGTDIQSACNNYAWIDGNTYTANNNTATHTIVGGATNGCDSIVTLNLTITGSVNGTDIQSACNSYAWIDGMTYTANNNTATHTILGGAANGCDSIVTLNLTITGNANGTDIQSACNSYAWIDGNTYTANNNTATHTIVGGATNGCDSIVTLNLTITGNANGTDIQSACNSYAWIDGMTYTANNNTATHTIVGGAANGCDSIVTLNLTITGNANGTDIQSACNSYAWIDGNTYTANNNTATHTIVGGATNGCDSIVTLNLTITGNTNGTDIQSACNSYTWIDGMTYTANNSTATHTIVGGATNGCDSIVTLNLTITGNTNGTDIQSACNSYTWIDGMTYTANNNTATHTIVGGATNGCDSIVTLNLTIAGSVNGTDIQSACNSYAWIDGNTYTANNNTATHTIVGGATNGCDSIVTLNLTIETTSGISIAQNGLNLEVSTGMGIDGYQWYYEGVPLFGDTNTTYYVIENGAYYCVGMQGNCLVYSDTIYVNSVSITTSAIEQVKIYPNPTKSIINIEGIENLEKIQVISITGKVLLNTKPTIKTIDFSNWAEGIYFIRLQSQNEQAIIKVTKI